MSFYRIWAVFLRYFYFFARLDHVCDLFYWPAMDIFLWGITSVWIQQHQEGIPHVALAILTGLVFWQILWRGNYEVSVNLLQEFWNRNLVNLFSTPLKLGEWILSIIMVGLTKILVTIAFGALLVWLLYAMNVFSLGWAFLPYAASLTLSGWIIGFLSASIIIRFGQRVQMLAWMTAYVFAPFSAIYYPVSALPKWAQMISHALPTSYIFEGMREILYEKRFSAKMLLISFALNFVYLVLVMFLFKVMFEKSRDKGLARLE
jgi:ABC-2 type transport system permease protein